MKTLNVSERDIRLTAAMRNAIKAMASLKSQPDSMRALIADAAIEVCDLIVSCPVKDWELAMERIEAAIAAL